VLSEETALLDLGDLDFAIVLHVEDADAAGQDDEEGLRVLSLLEDGRPRPPAEVAGGPDELEQGMVVQVGEQRDASQRADEAVRDLACQQAFIVRNSGRLLQTT
jgi:hypothetical protein